MHLNLLLFSHVIPKSREEHHIVGAHMIGSRNLKHIAVVLWSELDERWEGAIGGREIGQVVDNQIWTVITYLDRIELEGLELRSQGIWVVSEQLVWNVWQSYCCRGNISHDRTQSIIRQRLFKVEILNNKVGATLHDPDLLDYTICKAGCCSQPSRYFPIN